MHIIIGGAYNGKASWVRHYYKLANEEKFMWVSAYKKETIPKIIPDSVKTVILEGLEKWILEWCKTMSADQLRAYGGKWIKVWQEWENQTENRQVIVIGTDISKGIVPIDAEMRKWRDATGWLYQDLMKKSDRADIVWYGIATTLKG